MEEVRHDIMVAKQPAEIPASLYLHWPFCPYKCHFCPFVALASHDQFMESYHAALCQEIERWAIDKRRPPIKTLYMGGGTPSTYPLDLLDDLFERLNRAFVFEGTEVTIEVNPGTVSRAHLARWKEVGITRLSIGVQGSKESVLKGLNRHQSFADVLWLMENVVDFFDTVSIDLILGLPDVAPHEWRELIAQVVHWPINHLSMYFLTVHENTPLYFKVQQNKVCLPPDESLVDLYHWTASFLAQHGFERYELSNFARPGGQSRHNKVYWQRLPFKGFGLGAWSFDGIRRIQNEKNLMDYINKVTNDETVTSFLEVLRAEDVYLEQLMLHLRCVGGIALDLVTTDLTTEQCTVLEGCIAELAATGFLEEKEGRLRLTPRGLLVENEVIRRLLAARQ